MFDTIVWATDGSQLADGALPLVRELARAHGSAIVALHVNTQVADELEAQARLHDQVAGLRVEGLDAHLKIVWTGERPADRVIADVARELDADLIVVATHAYGFTGSIFAGHVAKALVHAADCPVLTVPPHVRALA